MLVYIFPINKICKVGFPQVFFHSFSYLFIYFVKFECKTQTGEMETHRKSPCIKFSMAHFQLF